MKKSTFIPITLFFTLFLISSFTMIIDNSFQIGPNKWKLTSAIVANESYGSKSKYELDIMNDSDDLSTAKTFIYFSITSASSTHLTDGSYQYSNISLGRRTPFHFSGSVKVNDQKLKITNGTFSIENLGGSAKIHFILKLENGDVANGSYNGKISLIDRSSNYR